MEIDPFAGCLSCTGPQRRPGRRRRRGPAATLACRSEAGGPGRGSQGVARYAEGGAPGDSELLTMMDTASESDSGIGDVPH